MVCDGHLKVFVMDLFSGCGCVASHHLSNTRYVVILDIDVLVILNYYYYYYSCFLNIQAIYNHCVVNIQSKYNC
jgi:hypothetical protein